MRAAVLVLLVLATAVRADTPAAPAAERQRAAADERAGNYEAAIGHLFRAHDADPQPLDLYAIAVDYERLGNPRQAVEWYERYLDAAPASPDRDRVTRAIADLKTRPSRLSVRTIPDGARVVIDAKPAGTTPLVVSLPGGAHHVEVELGGDGSGSGASGSDGSDAGNSGSDAGSGGSDAGVVRASGDVVLEYGEPADIAFALGGAAGTIAVGGGAPPGATLAIDDVVIGALPAHALFAAGSHVVRVTAPGYAPYETHVDVAAGATTRVDVELELARSAVPPAPAKQAGALGPVSFLAGGVIGGEIRGGAGYTALGVIGSRISHYDLVFRLGRAHGGLAYDFMARWQILSKPITPFLAVGYTYHAGGYGFLALGGVRWDVVVKPRERISLLLDAGIRDAPVDDTQSTATHVVVDPIELGVEAVFR